MPGWTSTISITLLFLLLLKQGLGHHHLAFAPTLRRDYDNVEMPLHVLASGHNGIDENEESNDTSHFIRYRSRVAYDGTGFNGWQTQPKGRTVQGDLETVLSRRFNRSVRIVGAGRTDAGVHARGQAFQFDLLPDELNVSDGDAHRRLQRSLNSMLRRDVRVWNVGPAPLLPPPANTTEFSSDGDDGIDRTRRWHVIYHARRKLYSYRISTSSFFMDPMQRHTRTHVHDPTDVSVLGKVLRHYEGTHDFRAFAGAIEVNERRSGKAKGTVRTVYEVNLVHEGGDDFRVDFLLQGALYKMVRNMMGTALEVAQGRMEESSLLTLLHHIDPDGDESCGGGVGIQYVRDDNKCKPAPPQGLTLEHVFFDDDDF